MRRTCWLAIAALTIWGTIRGIEEGFRIAVERQIRRHR